MSRVYTLNGLWKLKGGNFDTEGNIPGSVYSILLENKLIDDPYYRDNELKTLEIMDNEFTFTREFDYKKTAKKIFLVCEGIDTLCTLYLNDKLIANTDNMHRTFRFDVSDVLRSGKNVIKAVFPPIDAFVKEQDKNANISNGTSQTMKGFMHVRKAHCMFGWDWGPKLPDAGIWRNIYLFEADTPYITDVRILQDHCGGKVYLTVNACVSEACDVKVKIKAPNGEEKEFPVNERKEIENPLLWYPHGYGKQNLYTVTVDTYYGGKVCDEKEKRIGLRKLRLVREKDEYGVGFYHEVNGIKVFAMGADYIPEDNILSRCNRERTETLLNSCIDANFNTIRVWGGGIYPEDYFFDLCDEKGLLVFFDLMFACSSYPFGKEFNENVKQELYDNLKRIRHHASIAVISGNNEIEEQMIWYKKEDRKGYLVLFEKIIPSLIKEICPEIPFVPSSPSSFGKFKETDNENYGDSHYWSVWHGGLPFKEYRNHYFRYLSEFGFESYPNLKTVESFTLPNERNPYGRIMELHQRCPMANGKISQYISQTFLYPMSFPMLIYASQLAQCEAMKYAVEHLRRNRGRCMGTLYWQLNDIWPVASWSSIDCYGRYKALYYEAKRFYEPIHISCLDTGEYTVRKEITDERIVEYETKAQFFVNNETLESVSGEIRWSLNSSDGKVIDFGKEDLTIPALSVGSIKEIDFNKTDVQNNYLSFEFAVGGKTVSFGTTLFTKPKHFNFIDPELKCEINGDEITVTAKSYAKNVMITDDSGDLKLSDNFFDMDKGPRTVKILSGTPQNIKLYSVFDIK